MKKKLLATMAVVPLLGAFGTTGVLAATTKQVTQQDTINGNNTSDNNFQEDVTVKVTQGSEFQVIIPKEIVLDAQQNSGEYASDYTVVVSGNIAANETITVIPASTVELSQGSKTPLTASISQQDQDTTWDEIDGGKVNNLSGNISVSNVTAGNWEGQFNFDIALK